MLRNTLQSTSTFITKEVLHLPKPSLLERYTNIYVVFFLSGVVHYLHDAAQWKGPQIGTVLFFQSFAFGIMIEDGVQELWKRFTATKSEERLSNGSANKHVGKNEKDEETTPLWQKVVGHVWVFGFFVLVNPWFIYPSIRQPIETFWILPFKITDHIGLPVSAAIAAAGGLIIFFGLGGEP
jgi:hypothetical protein